MHSLIRNAALTYINGFVWQDIELTNEFKAAYASYIKQNGYDIEFLGTTAVITSSSTKYIFVPNQWFVIASYCVGVCEELLKYKNCFKTVADKLNRQFDEYARQLRDNATTIDKNEFLDCAKSVFERTCSDIELIEEAASRLWRFVNDYSWWSGQKTIDRGDFYVSVILNMLNLVNVSQGYVADIVHAYAHDSSLKYLTRDVASFTINMEGLEQPNSEDCFVDEEIREQREGEATKDDREVIPKPKRVKIRINATNTIKEIKLKG